MYPPAWPPASNRIEGLCTWRALLMLGGLLLHATMGEEHRPVFAAINLISGSFRMGAFFAISGLLTGFALARRADPAIWLRQRMVQLGVPTLFGVAVICPLIGAIFALGGHGGAPFQPNVYHLWFLFALLGYTPLVYGVDWIDRTWQLFERVERRTFKARKTQPLALLTVGGLSLLLMVVTMKATDAWVAPFYRPLWRNAYVLVGYFPLFLLGFAAARAPSLLRRLTARTRVPIAILVIAIAANILWRSRAWPALSPATWASLNDLITFGTAAWCAPAATALILRSAIRIRHVPLLMRRLSDA